MRVVQDPAGLVEAGEQAGAPPPGGDRGQALAGRRGPGAIGEVLGAEQLAADRSAEQFVRGVRAAGEKTAEEGRRRRGSDEMGLGECTSSVAPGDGADRHLVAR